MKTVMEERLGGRLNRRRDEGSLRQLMEPVSAKPGRDSQSPVSPSHLIDFASNDYLGLARCKRQHDDVESAYTRYREGCEGKIKDVPEYRVPISAEAQE